MFIIQQAYFEKQEHNTADDPQSQVLISGLANVLENFNPFVEESICTNFDPQEVGHLASADGDGRGRREPADHGATDECYQKTCTQK